MALFYPDNPKRATRVQQLANSIANMQTDIEKFAQQMDERNKEFRPTINALLRAKGHQSVDDLINNASARMSLDEKRKYDALIKILRNTKTGFEATYLISALLAVVPPDVKSSRAILAIARFGWQVISVRTIAILSKAVASGAIHVAKVAAALGINANQIALFLRESGEAAPASEAAAAIEGIAEAVDMITISGGGFEFLAGIVLSDAILGGKLKEELIDAIRRLQPLRLTTAHFKAEGMYIVQQLEVLQIYLDATPGGSSPDPALATAVSEKIIKDLTKANRLINLDRLESDLEAQDRRSGTFYGNDDLKHDEVIAAARKKKQ